MLFVALNGIIAQVTIGADKEPESFSVLEIVGNKSGLRLPQLTTTQRDDMTNSNEFKTLADTQARGLMIYNLDIDCMETWNGIMWLSSCGDALASSVNSSFNIKTHPDEFTNIALSNNSAITLEVEAEDPDDESAVFSYQWYKQTFEQQIQNSKGTKINGANNSTLLVDIDRNVRSNTSYYCVVSRGSEQLKSKSGRVLIGGCGAYLGANSTGWREFQCHNMGANVNSDPFTPSSAIHGAKYQWGTAFFAYNSETDQADWGAASSWTYPVTTSTWTSNPCTAQGNGWKMMTRTEAEALITNNKISYIGNDWSYNNGNFSTGTYIGEYLFFPASGTRNWSNGLPFYRGGVAGIFTTDTQSGDQGRMWHLWVGKDNIKLNTGYKSWGMTIRCLK
ncbi:hypothetical protein D0T49_00855 [Paludibacter sp. 221]|nr:hypothetical protein [Paludibacter sp. 221]